MKVYLYDEAGVQETQEVGDTKDGICVPREGEYVYGMTYKMRGHVTRVSYQFDRNEVFVTVKRD